MNLLVLISVIFVSPLDRVGAQVAYHESFPPDTPITAHVRCRDKSDVTGLGPTFTFSITNNGTRPLIVPDFPISFMLFPKIEDSDGKVIPRSRAVYSGFRSMGYVQKIDPGHTSLLSDFVNSHVKPRVTKIPVTFFGYELNPGRYRISISFSDDPDAKTRDDCVFDVFPGN